MKKWQEAPLQEGEVLIMWLGQAGFMFKNSQKKTLLLDAYLSDLSMRLDGNKRLTPALMDPQDMDVDVILSSHNHTDHLDVDSLPVLMRNGAKLYCSKNCVPLCEQAEMNLSQVQTMQVGDEIHDSGFTVKAVFADHGDTAPDALGFVIETEGIRIYYTGDTSYQMDRMKEAFKEGIDILLGPINGEYGNMNACDLAMLAGLAKPDLTIPCHFWTFARHKGNPLEFDLAMKQMAPDCKAYIMCQGEMITYKKPE